MANLQQAIAYFDEMLRNMPRDRTALEFLAVAYGQVGDEQRRRRTTVALADVLLAEGDLKSAGELRPTLREIGGPDALAAVRRIDVRLGSPTTARPSSAAPSAALSEGEVFAAVKSELELLRTLRSGNVISSATSDMAEKALFDMLSDRGQPLVSALAVIEREDPEECERAIAALADSTESPPIPLESYAVDADLVRLLPERIVFLRGVLPFARLADTVLVALLNPSDRALQREISDLAGSPCQYFTALPSAMEKVLAELRPERSA